MSVPLEPGVAERVRELRSADLVVGIPSFENARTIGHVVRAVAAGLAKHFPGRSAVIVNSDGGSRDGTPQVVASTELGSPRAILARHPLGPVHRILTPYTGLPGKGSALRTIFAIAERLGARACAVVDADLRSITPEWVELLLGPVVEHDFDYVAPLYLRHKYDGTITNAIVYPLTRSLYGREVRQPIGGEFGFSGRLASHYLTRPVWESDVARFGIDIWMTTTAVAGGFRVCESFLGAKIHDPKDPGTDVWGRALERSTLEAVAGLDAAGEGDFRFPDPLWVRVVHDFAIAYRRHALPREQLLRSLVPLYLGRTASFVLATADSGAEEVETAIQALADEFVRQKAPLRERWR